MKSPKIHTGLISLAIFACIITFCSCHWTATYNNRVEDKNEAQKVAEKFYDLLKKNDYNGTYPLYSATFLQATDTTKMAAFYRIISQKLGSILHDSLVQWQTHVVTGSNPSAEYFFFYVVRREKYESRESFTLSKENGTIKIDGFTVNSAGLLPTDSTK